MIPKIIHYCWFGRNPLPPLAEKCIASWKKFFPDYEIKRWDESNFNVNIIPYTAEAYKAKKYAFVSDYARFYILYQYGGLYFDTDVEVIRNMDDIISRGPFMGCEREASLPTKGTRGKATTLGVAPGLGLGVNPGLGLGVNPGLGLGVNPGLGLYKKLLDLYDGLSFDRDDNGQPLQTVVDITSEVLAKDGLKVTKDIQYIDGVYIYPSEYFNPLNVITKRMHITKNTRSIHHYMASWKPETFADKVKTCLRPFFPEKVLLLWNKRNNG